VWPLYENDPEAVADVSGDYPTSLSGCRFGRLTVLAKVGGSALCVRLRPTHPAEAQRPHPRMLQILRMRATGTEADEADATHAVREAWVRAPEAQSGDVGPPAAHRRSRSHMAQARASGHGQAATPERCRARLRRRQASASAQSSERQRGTSHDLVSIFPACICDRARTRCSGDCCSLCGGNPVHVSAPCVISENAKIDGTPCFSYAAKQSRQRKPTGLPALRRGIFNMRTLW
jgi:hypothetical protein